MNGNRFTVNILSTDETDDVLEVVIGSLQLMEDFVVVF